MTRDPGPPGAPRSRAGHRLAAACRHGFVLLLAAPVAFPFLWMLLASVTPADEIFRPGLRLVPGSLTLDHYRTALDRAPLGRYLLNGAIVTGGILLLQLLVIVPAAYAFGRLRFPGRDALFRLVLAGLVVPGYVTAIPNFLLLSRVGLTDSYGGLILPFAGSAFGIFLLRQFFRQLPGEILEAARLDGCGTAPLVWHILLPLTRPALAAFSLFSVATHWNDFFWPLVVIQSPRLYTPPAGIAYFADAESASSWGVVMAAAVIVVAPLLGLFLVARREFIASLAHVGLRG